MIVFLLMVALSPLLLIVFACYGLWIFGGWCCDRFDAWRADRYVKWHQRNNERHFH